MLDEQSGILKTGGLGQIQNPSCEINHRLYEQADSRNHSRFVRRSRFFYVAKASKRERNAELEGMPDMRSDTERMNNSDGKQNLAKQTD